jgi:hypothetical protein
MRTRLLIALTCYAVLAMLAWVLLEGNWRLGVWLLMVLLAVRTWIHTRSVDE